MRRREFIALLGGAAAWPLPSHAQQPERMRRIGVLSLIPLTGPGFGQRLQELGWTEGTNIQIEWRSVGSDNLRAQAKELVSTRPDVIVVRSSPEALVLRDETSTLPIVIRSVTDPVAVGLVSNLARPGGNITGFMNFEYSMGGKWLGLLKAIAPNVARVAILHNPSNVSTPGYLRAMEQAAQSLGIQLSAAGVRDELEIEPTIDAFVREPDGGMVVIADFVTTSRRSRTIMMALAERHKLPAVYPFSFFARAGGLMSYAPSDDEAWLRTAQYVDLILRGAKPGDLPIQAPTKFELVVNLKTAKALGLTVPLSLLVAATEVIE